MITTKEKDNENKWDKRYIHFIGMILILIVPFPIMKFLENKMHIVIDPTEFLTYHVILEFTCVIISFIIFTITYYTYRKIYRFRLISLFCTFLMVGSLDFFHMMGYYGMPWFFSESSISKATNFWILSRLILAIGLLISVMIPYNKVVKIKRIYFLVASIVGSFVIFNVVTFHVEILPPLFIEGQGLTKIKIILEYIIMGLFSISIIFYMRDYKITKDKIFMMIATGLTLGVFSEAAFTLYQSVYDTYNMLGHIYKLIGFYLIFKAIFVYNLDQPYLDLKDARIKIRLYANNLEKIVKQRTSEIQRVNEKMLQDLEYAKRIQESLLPQKKLNIYGVKFISEYIPCEDLSGDFFDIHVIDEENIGMYIADVAGHGVSAAIMTVFADRAIKPVNISNRVIKKHSPNKILDHFYKEFNKSDFPNEMHIVIFKGIYNVKTRILSYCSGGMNVLPILIRKNGSVEILDKSKGFPICKFGDFYSPKFENAKVQLEKGDRIIFYTDGLTESFRGNLLLKKESLINIGQNAKDLTLEELNQMILVEIKNNSMGLIHDDDITYFIMEA